MNLNRTAILSGSPYNRGPGFGKQPFRGGFKGACGCSPTTGCGCGKSGFGQYDTSAVQIDQVAVDWFNRIFGAVTGAPPAGSTVPVPGSPNYYSGAIPSWVPWVIIGFVAYKIIK